MAIICWPAVIAQEGDELLSRLMTLREQVLLAGLAGAVLLGAGTIMWYGGPNPAAPEIIPQEQALSLPVPVDNSSTPPAVHSAGVSTQLIAAPVAPAVQASAPLAVVKMTPGVVEVSPSTTASPPPIPAPQKIHVGVRGAVEMEGVYPFEEGSRIFEAIDAAGGAKLDANLDGLNLSAPLIDGTTLTVPRRAVAERDGKTLRMRGGGEHVYNPPQYTLEGMAQAQNLARAPAPASLDAAVTSNLTSTTQPLAGAGGKVNLNTADQSALETLPGIGPKLAQRILDYRAQVAFTKVEDLMNVSGIAQGRFDAVKDFITVD